LPSLSVFLCFLQMQKIPTAAATIIRDAATAEEEINTISDSETGPEGESH